MSQKRSRNKMLEVFNGLLAALKLKKIKPLKYRKTDFNNFVKSLSPGAIVLTRERKPSFLQRAVEGLTKSSWQHALIYIGDAHAKFIRQKHPEFFRLKENYQPPDSVFENEIVEANDGGIKSNTLNLYFKKNVQMIAWNKILSQSELEKILRRAYSLLGSPYDLLEYYGHAFFALPDDREKYTCSSFVAYCHGLPIKKATPAALNRYCMPRLKWQYIKYNW